MSIRASSLIAALSIAVVPALPAQDGYASAVAVAGGDVVVLKPGAGRGAAGAYVYHRVGGVWQIAEVLRPPGGEDTGEGFSASMAAFEPGLLVGSGDPSVAYGARAFRHHAGANPEWILSGGLGFVPEAEMGPRATVTDLASLMRIMQPAPRVVAGRGGRVLFAAVGGPTRSHGVRLAEWNDSTEVWREIARLEVAGLASGDRFGASLAIGERLVAVGAPGRGAGEVYLFRQDAVTAPWERVAQLAPADSTPGGGFGTALALIGDTVFVGRPGPASAPGRVMMFVPDPATGGWVQQGHLAPEMSTPGDGFGATIARTPGHILVGAPGADGQRGRVSAFRSDGAAGWRLDGSLDAVGSSPGSRLGSALSAGPPNLVVAGAPGDANGRGGAAVFTWNRGGEWTGPEWLRLEDDLELIAGGEVACEEGRAAGFECNEVDLVAFLPLTALGAGPGEGVSDVWGWTDPDTRREYALVGRSAGLAVVDVTDPQSPTYLGLVAANRSGARDIKVYRDHAFFTGDGAGAHGLQVFDLTRLRNVVAPPVQFEADAVYDGIASAHNLVIDTESGFAYPVGASAGGTTCGGGLHMIDIRDPMNPAFAGCYTDTEGLIWQGRTHDAQCVVYRGPDENYQGRQICFASNETALRIVDVTEKGNPVPIAAATYPGIAYVHQGWLTEDHRYFYLDDELDELVGQADRTRTLVWDVAELDDPLLVGQVLGPDRATDHNLYVKGDRMYQANYQAGLRVLDISDPRNPVEVGFFDTTPYEGNPAGFAGAWTAYPFFDSGTVVVTSMAEGLFLLRPRRQELVP